jgi:hypothetical protein
MERTLNILEFSLCKRLLFQTLVKLVENCLARIRCSLEWNDSIIFLQSNTSFEELKKSTCILSTVELN